MGIPDHLTCLLRNLHAYQDATVRTRRGKMNSFQIVKGVHQGCCYPAFLFCYPAYLTYMQSAVAAAKSLQSCPTLCNPTEGSPPGSPIPGTLQARTMECVAISFSNAWQWKVKVKSLCRVWLLGTPWTAAYQAPPSVGFSRQDYWSGVPVPSPYMQSTGCEMPGRMKHKLESWLLGEISTTSDMQMTPLYGRKWRGTKELLDVGERQKNQRTTWWRWKRRVKSWPKTQHSENKDHGIQSYHFMADRWETNSNSDRL